MIGNNRVNLEHRKKKKIFLNPSLTLNSKQKEKEKAYNENNTNFAHLIEHNNIYCD